VSITLRIPLFQAKEMTLPQQNIASARPTSFYYLMCQLDRVQYPSATWTKLSYDLSVKSFKNISGLSPPTISIAPMSINGTSFSKHSF
ncbi:hypothetical protein, partial [Limosilactobacillus fermentum]|uniref:hypothetical protein n=1 Tax=Limosilactobacillus fermentum TaxID=1613 RepID=UPI0021A76DF1